MLATALAIAAIALALVEELRARGTSLVGWAVVFLAIIHLIGRIP